MLTNLHFTHLLHGAGTGSDASGNNLMTFTGTHQQREIFLRECVHARTFFRFQSVVSIRAPSVMCVLRVGVGVGVGGAYVGIGWGYGLLLADDIPTFLLQLFTAAAHANTRGTWTAPEEADIGGGAMPYASSSQLLMPVNLKWML